MTAYVVFKGNVFEASAEKIASAERGIKDARKIIEKEEKYSPEFRKQHVIEWHQQHIATLEAHIEDMKQALAGRPEDKLAEAAIASAYEIAEKSTVTDGLTVLILIVNKLTRQDLKDKVFAETAQIAKIGATSVAEGISFKEVREQVKLSEDVIGEIIAEEVRSSLPVFAAPRMFFHLDETAVTEQGLLDLEARRKVEAEDLATLGQHHPARSGAERLARYNDAVSWDMKVLLARPYDRSVAEEILTKSAIRDAERYGAEEGARARKMLKNVFARVSTPRLKEKLTEALSKLEALSQAKAS